MEGTAAQQRLSASLYVGDLPIDLPNPEDTLFNLFNKVGMVISIKVCRDVNTQRSLGYAYVNFQAPADAERALEQLNYSEIIPGRQIRIMWSLRDPAARKAPQNNIFVKNLDPSVTTRTLRDTFAVFGNILSCKLATNEAGVSRGYGFVHFESAEAADKALTLDGTDVAASKISVTPFIKKSDREQAAEQTFTSIYIKNLKSDVTEDTLKEEIAKAGGAVKSLYVSAHPQHKTKFALVTLESHDTAITVIEKLNGADAAASPLADSEQNLVVCRALKKSDRVQQDRQVQNLYQSQGRNIYIKHLDDTIDSEKLNELFSQFGKITSCELMKDTTGNSRGFAFVCFESKDSATAAIREMNGKLISRRPLYVSMAQQKDMRHRMLEDQRKTMFAQQQRMNMQMSMYNPPWNRPPWPTGPLPGFVPPFNVGPQGIRRPPLQRPVIPRGGAALTQPRMMNPVMGQPTVGIPRFTQPPAQVRPFVPPASPQQITASTLARLPQDEQKNYLGERLYARIQEINPSQAAKITGMLLEMETSEILNVLEDTRTLNGKVSEAVAVLQQHDAASR
jgi:polyadenylate-binding protein